MLFVPLYICFLVITLVHPWIYAPEGPSATQYGTLPHPRGIGQSQVRAWTARHRLAHQAHDWRWGDCVCGGGRAHSQHPGEGVVSTSDPGECYVIPLLDVYLLFFFHVAVYVFVTDTWPPPHLIIFCWLSVYNSMTPPSRWCGNFLYCHFLEKQGTHRAWPSRRSHQ